MADARTTEKKAAVHKKRLDSPDETRPIGKGKLEIVNVDGVTIVRSRHDPGWKWSEDASRSRRRIGARFGTKGTSSRGG